MFQKSIDTFRIWHQKFLITLYIFRSSSARAHDQRCINTLSLEFTPSVGDFISNFELPTNADGLYPSVESPVIVAFPVNIFATLCEMPTDCICL
jgi:hypothetical protein